MYFGGSNIQKIVIPEGVKELEIERCAFSYCRKLEQITFVSNELESLFIGDYVFQNSPIKALKFPKVKNLTIREDAFTNSHIEEIVIP